MLAAGSVAFADSAQRIAFLQLRNLPDEPVNIHWFEQQQKGLSGEGFYPTEIIQSPCFVETLELPIPYWFSCASTSKGV